jgi:dienelactone hydrolase
MEDLASRGYVVASIAHPGEAAVAPFPDGRRILLDTSITNANQRMVDSARRFKLDIERMMDSIGQALSVPDRATRQANFRGFLAQAEEPLRSQSVREWALDTRALVDRLEQLDQGVVPSPFQGRLDLQRLGVFGMSYGGATAGEFCMEDARCKAAINIDGGQYGRLVDDSLMVPLLILGSSQAPGVHVPVLDMVRGPAWLAVVPATTHIGLTDMTLMGPVLFRWLGVTGKLDPDYREAIMTGYVTGFFEKFLRGQPALFDSLPTRFPDVTVTTRNVP